MWISFFAAVAFSSVLVILPGCILMRALKLSAADCIALSPSISIVMYCAAGAGYGLAGIEISSNVLIMSTLAFSLAISFLMHVVGIKPSYNFCSTPGGLIPFLTVGVIGTMVFYIIPLDGPNSYVQLFDNAYHLNLIRSFVESGRYSLVQASAVPASGLTPFGDISFYPAAWHVLCSCLVDFLGVSVSLAQNAINTVFLSVVFPSGVFIFVTSFFGQNSKYVKLAPLFLFAFAAFPWGFLVAGPLYSNFAALCLLPSAMAIYKFIVSDPSFRSLRFFVLFLLSSVALVFAQPNVIFTAVVIMVPYTVYVILTRPDAFHLPHRLRKAAAVLFILIVMLILIASYLSPFLSGVVDNEWVPYAPELHQGLVDFIDLGYRNAVAQLFLGALVVAGLAECARRVEYRWVLFSYLTLLISYLNAACTEFGLFGSSFFSGFWYNDVDRIAANAVMLLIPVAVLGFESFVDFASRLFDALKYSISYKYTFLVVTLLFVLVNYSPSFIVGGRGEVVMSLGNRADRLSELATTEKSLTAEEVDFLKGCKKIVGDSRVLNFPYDGSAFGYMEAGLNTVYRTFFAEEDLKLLNRHIDDFVSNPLVVEKLNQIGAEYILMLDCYDNESSTLYDDFLDARRKLWTGFLDGRLVSEESELETVLSEGDMRLYRVPPR